MEDSPARLAQAETAVVSARVGPNGTLPIRCKDPSRKSYRNHLPSGKRPGEGEILIIIISDGKDALIGEHLTAVES